MSVLVDPADCVTAPELRLIEAAQRRGDHRAAKRLADIIARRATWAARNKNIDRILEIQASVWPPRMLTVPLRRGR